ATLPSTTIGGSGIGCACSNVLFSSFSATCGSCPTASRNGFEIPSSVWTRTGYTPTATVRSTVSLTFQAEASPLFAGSDREGNGAINRGFSAKLAPLKTTSVVSPRRTPDGVTSLICGGAARTVGATRRPKARARPRALHLIDDL